MLPYFFFFPPRGQCSSTDSPAPFFSPPLRQVFIFSRSEVGPGEYECWGHFAEPWGLKAYVTWMTVAVFLLPALIITVCQVGPGWLAAWLSGGSGWGFWSHSNVQQPRRSRRVNEILLRSPAEAGERRHWQTLSGGSRMTVCSI